MKKLENPPPALRGAQFRQAAGLLGLIMRHSEKPADKHMETYFRQQKAMGVRDRGFVAETVYGCLRRRRFLEYLAGENASSDTLVAVYLLASQGWSARALTDAGFAGDANGLVARTRTLDKTTLPLAVRTDLPDWLLERLLVQLGESETVTLADALNQPAPLDLRVNTLKADRETVAQHLAGEGFPAEPTPWSPLGLRRRERLSLFTSATFKAGLFEVQDEGSQLLGLLLEPKRREMVVDFCAGAGGKTLHLGALMANSGTLYALDIAQKRLEELKPRLKRAGLDTVRVVAIAHERDARVQRLHGKIDRVLVDAPCSGTGTLRRNPDIKWRTINLEDITAIQQRILIAAAALVKPGGRLVYATCSLLREENEDIVHEFLVRHPAFRVLPAEEIMARRHIQIPGAYSADGALRLYPHRHGTDGFYAIALQKTAS
ncbi:MAG: RsmB/NOP family class I SAM-dependent RNA methyltransferase [Pseudomonadota bacterium]